MTPLRLPYPVSANRYWRTYRNITVRSEEANAYRWSVIYAAEKAKSERVESNKHVCINIVLLPKLTKKGEASKVRLDLDNCIKVVLDALIGIAYEDDRQVVKLVAEIGRPVAAGGLTVEWEAQRGND